MSHAADRLLDAVHQRGAPVCVGLDPVLERLPAPLRRAADDSNTAGPAMEDAARAIEAFCAEVLAAIAPIVPCVKFQSACFERYGSAGVAALRRSIAEAAHLGLHIILDAKRGDIGITAEHYARAAFARDAPADWITINSYFGSDGITPFVQPGRGAFVLVRTSNPSSDAVQQSRLHDGRTVAESIAQLVADLGSATVGARGYSALGAVVAATKPRETARLRDLMPQQIFLVPGYGAQGGRADDVLNCFKPDGSGAIITASRSIIYAFEPSDPHWPRAIADAAATMADELRNALG